MKADLLDRFKGFARSRNLFSPDDRILLALSGGPDSLALTDLFSRAGQPVTLAHCNFRLRGAESDLDEEFVRKVALVYDFPLLVASFDTAGHARQSGISIEMAARELRYQWFEQAREESGCRWIAVAHHADDSVETMLINLARGTGLRGLCGIQPLQGNVIRPLLFTNREEVLRYLEFRNLGYRQDSSNDDHRFNRNRIRHVVLPELGKINPSVGRTIRESQQYLLGALGIMEEYLAAVSRDLVSTEPGLTRILIDGLRKEKHAPVVLFELLRPFGFNSRQVQSILGATEGGTGRIFHSRTHTLVVDREYILLSESPRHSGEKFYFDPDHPDPELPGGLTGTMMDPSEFLPVEDPNKAFLDYDRLDFPLVMRRWEKGDFFYPLGMNHPKKISDFFIDRKVDRLTKEKTWILASGEQVVWIIGFRIDHRFRVTESTSRVLALTFGNS